MEEILVQWDPENCTLQEAQMQQAQGFVITSITSLDVGVPTPLIQAATAIKRPRGRPKNSERLPPYTKCRVQFAPSPEGPTHIRTIRGGIAALDAFLLMETTRPPAPPPGPSEASPQATPPPRVARGCTHRPAQGGGQLHHPLSRPPGDRTLLPRRLSRPAERTQTCFKSSLRKETRTEMPPPAKDLTYHSYRRHPHGTLWGQT